MREMAEDWDNCCPLCMEEMDSTDRQLKPCRCGYQICVWCWNHIMEMAEKDNTEGRCPACRTVYNREKIVCRSVDINNDRKQKSGKSKLKSAEGRKNLSNVRVIQRNLVYVIGIPTALADEETLERKEYFGQYGKILKISVSKPTGHNSQHSSTSPSVGVYVTYVKEEDALRCIESVNGYTLEGKVLKACFGTTKYCNAWLKYMPCNNPECLYLHDEGTREDSFTKEEMLAKYGSKSQHFHELTHPPQRRSGAVLPPPMETSVVASTSHTPSMPGIVLKTSSPIGILPKSSTSSLPAAASWGSRSSNCSSRVPGTANRGVAISTVKSKPVSGLSTSMNSSFTGDSMDVANNSGLKSNDTNEAQTCGARLLVRGDLPILQTDTSITSDTADVDLEFARPMPGKAVSHSRNSSIVDDVNHQNGDIQEDLKSDSSFGNDVAVNTKDSCLSNVLADKGSSSLTESQQISSAGSENFDTNLGRDIDEAQSSSNINTLPDSSSNVHNELVVDTEASNYSFEMVNRHLEFATHQNAISDVSNITIRTPSSVGGLTTLLKVDLESNNVTNIQGKGIPISDDLVSEDPSWLDTVSNKQSSNCMKRDIELSQISSVSSDKQDSSRISEKVVNGCREHDLIFDMFKTGFDLWTDGNPQDLAQILFNGKNVEPQSETPSQEGLPWKSSSSKHSRFHFARQDDAVEGNNNLNFQAGGNDRHAEKQFTSINSNASNSFGDITATSSFSSSKSIIGAPPGFSAIRPASVPPGFSQHNRTLDSSRIPEASHDTSKYLGVPNIYNQSEASKVTNDVEFIDPAIMAVGKGKLQPGIRSSPMSFPNSPLAGFVGSVAQPSRQVNYDSLYQERSYRNGTNMNSISQHGFSNHERDSSLQSLFQTSFNNVVDQQQRLPGQSMFQHVIQDSVYANGMNKFRCQPTSWDDWNRFSDVNSTSSQGINDAAGRLTISQMVALQNRFEESALSKELGSKYYADIGIHDDQRSFSSGKMGPYYLQK